MERWIAMSLAVSAGSVAMGQSPVEYPISAGGNGHYYEVVTGPSTWAEAADDAARRRVLGINGHLATIGTAGEQAFVFDLVRDRLGMGRQAWLGGSAQSGSFNRDLSWTEGAEGEESVAGADGVELWRTFVGPVDRRFENFVLVNGQPMSSDGGHFAMDSTSGEWLVSPGPEGELAYVVEYPIPVPQRPVQWGRDAAGNLHWYEVVNFPRIFSEATADAESRIFRGHRGHLATITSQEEWEFAYHLVVGNVGLDPVGLVFLGATGDSDSPNNSDYTWRQGPEAGTLFYSTGPVPGEFHAFNPDAMIPSGAIPSIDGEVLMRGTHGQWGATNIPNVGFNRALIEWSIEGPVCLADTAEPLGVLDLADISAFTSGVMSQSVYIDIAQPFGVIDLADINAFITAFQAGCD